MRRALSPPAEAALPAGGPETRAAEETDARQAVASNGDAWPGPRADAEEDLLRWDDVWTFRDGCHLTPREGEALARVSPSGTWEVRADVAALLRAPRYGADPRGAVEAIPEVHRRLWEGRRDLRLRVR